MTKNSLPNKYSPLIRRTKGSGKRSRRTGIVSKRLISSALTVALIASLLLISPWVSGSATGDVGEVSPQATAQDPTRTAEEPAGLELDAFISEGYQGSEVQTGLVPLANPLMPNDMFELSEENPSGSSGAEDKDGFETEESSDSDDLDITPDGKNEDSSEAGEGEDPRTESSEEPGEDPGKDLNDNPNEDPNEDPNEELVQSDELQAQEEAVVETNEQNDLTGDYFQFEVTVTAGQGFTIPTSGYTGGSATGKTNNWNIDWGDGTTSTNVSVVQSSAHAGIAKPASYSNAGSYIITIRPAGSTEAWMSCFGFYDGDVGANVSTNKQKISRILGPITPQMTRMNNQFNQNAPDYEWSYAFYNCTRLTEGPHLSGWELVTVVGNSFLHGIFYSCTSLTDLPEGFTLPQNLTTVGSPFASNMFTNCTSLAELPAGFNLPQNLTTAGNNFAFGMFQNCRSLAGLPEDFNLPQNLVSVGIGFAYQMFYGAGSTQFQLNQSFAFPALIQAEANKTNVFYQTFLLSASAPLQNRTAASIIGTCATPGASRYTFGDAVNTSKHWVDQPGLAVNWGGLQLADYFQFEVTVTSASRSFSIPASGWLGASNTNKTNNWKINWGDGTSVQTATVTQSGSHLGVQHTYASAGSYVVTITPAGSTDAWLSCFGFSDSTMGANASTNKQKLTKVYGPIAPNMTRRADQLLSSTPPSHEWCQTFHGCSNLVEGPRFTGWTQVISVGDSFAQQMFDGCTSLAQLPADFNLPQGITSVGSYFADSMFLYCESLNALPADFNLPQGLSAVGNNFAAFMFFGAGSSSFQMNDTFVFPVLTAAESSKVGVFMQTFWLSYDAPLQERTAVSIINGCATPEFARGTFGDGYDVSTHWIDQPGLHANWGGLAAVAELTIELRMDVSYIKASDFMVVVTNTDTSEVYSKILRVPAGQTVASFSIKLEAGNYTVQTISEGGTWRYGTGGPVELAIAPSDESQAVINVSLINSQWMSDTSGVLNIMREE